MEILGQAGETMGYRCVGIEKQATGHGRKVVQQNLQLGWSEIEIRKN
jgi:hypothetical protein